MMIMTAQQNMSASTNTAGWIDDDDDDDDDGAQWVVCTEQGYHDVI